MLPTEIKFDIKLHSNHFSSKKHTFAFWTKKTWIERQLFWKTAKLLPIKPHISKQKKSNVISALSEIMNLKSDQLEILLSVQLKFGVPWHKNKFCPLSWYITRNVSMGHGCPRYCQIPINRALSLTKGHDSNNNRWILSVMELYLYFMILYLCMKYESNTPMYSKDIAQKPFTYADQGP